MSDRTFVRKKATASDFSEATLVSPSTPTLANPVRGFGLPTNSELSTQQQEIQSADEQDLEQLIQKKPLGHDISRISFRRPQAKLTVGEPGDKYEQEADIMARRVMAMSASTVQRQILPSVQTIPPVSGITPLAQREAISQEEEIRTKPALQRRTNDSLNVSSIPKEQVQLDGEEGDNPLTPVQVQNAKNWYAGKRTQYTPEIIRQIQTSVGVEATGVMNDETVQAVARWQQSNSPLQVDGIAGPRTLPALFPGGLARAEEMDQYVTETKQVQADWATLTTPQARADALMVIVNARLTAAGVPNCIGVLTDVGAAAGQFDFTIWQIQLGQQRFSQATITDESAADIANTIYHEARHAEQWFRMAQMLAGQGKTAREIETQMSIPATIAAQAVASPLAQGSMEALIAQGWYESVYGGRANYRNGVLQDVLSKKTALNNAQEAYDTNPTPRNEARLNAARRRFEVAYQKYVNLPEEADAHRVGNAVEARYRLP